MPTAFNTAYRGWSATVPTVSTTKTETELLLNPGRQPSNNLVTLISDNLHIASNEAFLLTSPAVRALYEDKYRETASLYYAGQVPFQNMLERFAHHLDRL